MPELTAARIAELITPYFAQSTPLLLDQLSAYLDLLMKWNARTNLTAIRDPQEMVRRHFGESLLAALHVPATAATLLDLGSGAGFPGLPIQLALPHLRVTLAESQGKKAAFLREVVRSLCLPTEVWSQRAEELPVGKLFDVVAMRAVDKPDLARALALSCLSPGGTMLEITTMEPGGEGGEGSVLLPGTTRGILRVTRMLS